MSSRRLAHPSARLALLALLALGGCERQHIPPDAFVVILDAQVNGFDPRFPVGDSSAKIIGLLHAGLTSTDTATGEPELELAESITQRSPLIYDITLRQNLTFHDGSPLTSRDVEYTLTKLGGPPVSSPLAGMSERIASFEVHDPRRFTITLKDPYAPFMSDLSMGIVPRALCEGKAQCPDPPIGAGPFKWTRRHGDQVFVMERFEQYVQGPPAIKTLAFQVIQDDNTRLLALLGGSASLVQNAVAPLMLPVVKGDDRLTIATSPSFKYTYLAYNLRVDKLKDVRVRQAIAHGIDREAIIRYKYAGLARLSSGMLAPEHWAYEGDVATYAYDPARAMALLDEAGFPDPDGPDGPLPRMTLELKVSSSKFRRALAVLMANQLARIGIAVKVRSYEWGTYFADIKSGNFEMTTLQWPSVMEPSLYRWAFHSENIPSAERRSAGANRGGYHDPELDALLDAGMTETDREARRDIYAKVQQQLARELPYVSLWHEDNIAVMRRGVEGYAPTPNARFELLKRASAPPKEP